MHSNKGQDLPRHSAGVLNNDVSSAGKVSDVVDYEWSAAGLGAVGKKCVEDMPHNPVFLRYKVRRVVLDVLGFSDKLREKLYEGVSVEIAHRVLHHF